MKSIGDKSPAPFLRAHLKLENNPAIFNEIRKLLNSKSQKYLDLKRPPVVQRDAFTKIEQELREEYPDIFDTEDNQALYLAGRLIIAHHHNKRFSHSKDSSDSTGGKGIKPVTREEQKPKIFPETSPKRPGRSLDARIKFSKYNKEDRTKTLKKNREPRAYLDKGCDERSLMGPLEPATSNGFSFCEHLPREMGEMDSQLGNNPRSHVKSQATTSSISSAGTTVSSGSQSSLAQQSSISSTSHTVSSSSSSSSSIPTINPLFFFLDACVPSMAHLYPLFVKFQCSTEEQLFSVSTWPSDLVCDLLNKIAYLGDDEAIVVGEMDKMILQNHFKAYFSASYR